MAASATKADIIARHLANDLLQSAVLMPMRRDVGDLSAEQPTAAPADSMIQSAVDALNHGQTHYVAALWDQDLAPWVEAGDYPSLAVMPTMNERTVAAEAATLPSRFNHQGHQEHKGHEEG